MKVGRLSQRKREFATRLQQLVWYRYRTWIVDEQGELYRYMLGVPYSPMHYKVLQRVMARLSGYLGVAALLRSSRGNVDPCPLATRAQAKGLGGQSYLGVGPEILPNQLSTC